MKNTLRSVVLSNVLLVAVSMVTVVGIVPQANRKESNPIGLSVFTILQAQHHNDKERPKFAEKATLTYSTDSSSSSPRRLQGKKKLSTGRSLVRYDKASLNTDQSFLFDGQILIRTTSQAGINLEVRVLNRFEIAGIRIRIAAFRRTFKN